MKTILSIVLCLCLVFPTIACSTSWVTEATAIVAVLLPAAGNVLALVSAFTGKGIDPADLEAINKVGLEITADLNQIGSLISSYNDLPADQKASRLDQIESVIKLAQSHASDFLTAGHIKNQSLQNKVNAIMGLVISELESVKTLLPIIQSGGKMTATRVNKPMGAKQLKRAVNAVLSSPSGDSDVDQKASLLVLK